MDFLLDDAARAVLDLLDARSSMRSGESATLLIGTSSLPASSPPRAGPTFSP
ncbi:MAG: hypothetical protein U0521_16245 [Anaerolineae bacterium]